MSKVNKTIPERLSQALQTLAKMVRSAVEWAMPPAPQRSWPPYFRPQLKELEPRYAPAVLYWQPPAMDRLASNYKNWVDSTSKVAPPKLNPSVDTYIFNNKSVECTWDIASTVLGVKVESGYGNGGTQEVITLSTDMKVSGTFVDEATNVKFAGGAARTISLTPAAGKKMNVTWAGNTTADVAVTFGAGTTTTLSGTSKEFDRVLTVSGRANLTQGNMLVNQFVISASGVFDAKADLTIEAVVLAGGNAASIVNNGIFEKTAGGGSLIVDVAFENKKNVIIGSGTMELGSTTVQTGATAATVLQDGTALEASIYRVNGGTFYGGDGTVFTGELQINGAYLVAMKANKDPAKFTVKGNLVLDSNAVLYVRLYGAAFSQYIVQAQPGAAGQGNVTLTGAPGITGPKLRISVENTSYATKGQRTFLSYTGIMQGNFSAWKATPASWTVGLNKGEVKAVGPVKNGYTVTVIGDIPLPPAPARGGAGKVVGMAWLDDGNGVRDAGEAVAAGVTVYLLDANGQALASTTTDSSGAYEFDDLAAGTYSVALQLPDNTLLTGYEQSSDPSLGSDINPDTLTSAPLVLTTDSSTATANIGLLAVNALTPSASGDADDPPLPPSAVPDATPESDPPMTAAIAGRVFFDANHNGQRDPSEYARAGVAVCLTDASGNVVASDTTDGDGWYAFDGLSVGTYRVHVTLPDNSGFTTEHAAAPGYDSDVDSAGQSDPVIIGTVYDIPEVDAGLVPPPSSPLIMLSESSQWASLGQTVTFTATVSSGSPNWTATGTVSFYDNGILMQTIVLTQGMSGMMATLATASLAAGDHTITATYNGDANDAPTSATQSIYIMPM